MPAGTSPVKKRRRRRIGLVCITVIEVAYELYMSQPAPPILPVEPADLVILAIGVVVALLAAPDLVASEQHRHAL